MVTQFDEKGKIFTTVVSKHPVKVVIQMLTNQIRGEFHVRNDFRVKDELDASAKFLPITNATVFSSDGSITIYKTRFMPVNKNQIMWMIPEEELLLE